jgi:hypothetical protein
MPWSTHHGQRWVAERAEIGIPAKVTVGGLSPDPGYAIRTGS